jgi:predicted nucleic-acid-binding protein
MQAALALQVLQKATLIAVPATALCEMVWVLLRGYRYTPLQVANAVRTLMQVRHVVCDTPAVLAGLAMLEGGGDFADGVIAFEGTRLGGAEFVSFDQQAAKLLKAQKRKVRLLSSK